MAIVQRKMLIDKQLSKMLHFSSVSLTKTTPFSKLFGNANNIIVYEQVLPDHICLIVKRYRIRPELNTRNRKIVLKCF